MSTPCYDTVILSDLHLGSEVSRAKAALQMLKAVSFRRLILLGDIFCDLNFRRLKKEHWQFLSYIRKLSNPKRAIEVVWVEGNHDHGLSEVMSHLVGVAVFQEYEWTFRGIRHLAIHGHQFDGFLVSNRLLTNFFIAIHESLQKIPIGRKRIVGFLERFDTVWLRLSDKVAKRALEYARTKKVDRVFCGHTHESMHATAGSTDYFNTGSWTQDYSTYITIDDEGVMIHGYEERADDHCPDQERGDGDSQAADLARAAGLPAMSSSKLYLVDGASTDHTREVALSFWQWLDITILPPGPEPVSRNAVARLALTRYLLFLEPEIEIYDPTLIRRTVEMAKQRGLHCVTTNVSSPAMTSWDRLLYLENNVMQKLSRICRSNFLLFDRAAFEALGGFDEKGLFAEDYLLSRKVARGKFAVIPGRVATTNQQLQKLGCVGLLRLFFQRSITSPQAGTARVSS